MSSATAQRSSPQFSFPPPSSNQFGADIFSNAGAQDLSQLGQPSTSQLGGQSSLSLASLNGQQQDQQQGPTTLLAQSQPAQSQSQQQQQQPGIQLSRPSLSLTSLTAPSQQSQSQQQQSQPQQSSRSSSGGSQARDPQQHQSSRHHSSSSSSSSSSASGGAGSQQASGSSVSASAAPAPHKPAKQLASSNHHQSSQQQHPSNLQTQQTSQSINAGNSQQAAIELARKAEATAASLAAANSGLNYRCPDSFGFFRHHKSCDKYWACENGTATLKLCGNGLMFDDSDPKRENCAYPFSVDCGADRVDLEPPISTPHCPRLYGLFPDTANCRVFFSCWNGEASKYECPPGLAYDNEQRVCVWADLVERCDQSEVSDGFVCPDPTEVDQPGHYTRHAHPTDCRKFYVCIEGVARPYGCSLGTVFNVDSLQCDEPENVSGCEKYYGDTLEPKLAKKLAREGTVGQSPNPASSSQSRSSSSSSSSSSSQQQG